MTTEPRSGADHLLASLAAWYQNARGEKRMAGLTYLNENYNITFSNFIHDERTVTIPADVSSEDAHIILTELNTVYL